jgi:hypothetical protein
MTVGIDSAVPSAVLSVDGRGVVQGDRVDDGQRATVTVTTTHAAVEALEASSRML